MSTRKKIPTEGVNDTVSPQAEEKTPVKDDNFDDSFYKGHGGCYTTDEFGRVVPVTDKGR